MKMTLFVVRAQLLLIALITVAYVSIRKSSAQEFPLNMAENSVDDDYKGCEEKMEQLVLDTYIEREIMKTPGFAAAWKNALNIQICSEEKTFKKQCAAIYLYTGDPQKNKNCSYIEFNAATRNGKTAYKSNSFQFYTLFFYLTDAVEQLKLKECKTVYRRTKNMYQTDVLNKEIRFGSFTSTSLEEPPLRFGNKSCFEVKTCFGADLTKYSKFKHEREVLIPPYEVFRVTNIKKKDKNKDLWCEVVYELKSTKKMSDLHCAKVRS